MAQVDEDQVWWNILVLIVLNLCSSAISGLNLGVLSLEPKQLKLLTTGPFETKQDEKYAHMAKKLLPLRERGNLILCAILLGNVAVNSAISITTANLTDGIVGFVVSTATVMVVGEIVP